MKTTKLNDGRIEQRIIYRRIRWTDLIKQVFEMAFERRARPIFLFHCRDYHEDGSTSDTYGLAMYPEVYCLFKKAPILEEDEHGNA